MFTSSPCTLHFFIGSLFMESEQRGSGDTHTKSSPKKIWVPPCSLAAAILLFSSTPGAYFPSHPNYLNNIVHLTEFALLAFLLARALLHGRSLTNPGLLLWTTAICVSFGFLDEAHQFLVPERMFDLKDLLYDSVGAVAGSGAYILFKTLNKGRFISRTAATGETDD
ncbi:MAG: VanZ family protein [bacterium]|nr:VanZ family protein [bacterium]